MMEYSTLTLLTPIHLFSRISATVIFAQGATGTHTCTVALSHLVASHRTSSRLVRNAAELNSHVQCKLSGRANFFCLATRMRCVLAAAAQGNAIHSSNYDWNDELFNTVIK
jgi:hypothetical protein